MSARPFNYMEHRWGQRLDVSIAVHFNFGLLKGIDGRLRNLSSSGGLMTACHPVRPRALLEIEIRLPFADHLVIEAHVTRASNAAVGLEWCQPACVGIRNLLKQAAIVERRRRSAAPEKDWRSRYPIPFDGAPDA